MKILYRSFLTISILSLFFLTPASVQAWHGVGHVKVTMAALDAVKDTCPAFFYEGRRHIAHAATEPDINTLRIDAPQLYNAESPNHYFHVDIMLDHPFPQTREAFLVWCVNNDQEISHMGTLPYALTESVQKLTIALAEYRTWPDNDTIRAKSLFYAGLVAHYAQDACMPLHLTYHYDGRTEDTHTSPRTGIHRKLDAALQKLPVDQYLPIDPNALTPCTDVLNDVYAHMQADYPLVDRVYELEDQIPALTSTDPLTPAMIAFLQQRAAACTTFTARLLITAWHESANVIIPDWRQADLDAVKK